MGALASANREEQWDKSLADLMYKTLYETVKRAVSYAI
jgi:hypothetical protein